MGWLRRAYAGNVQGAAQVRIWAWGRTAAGHLQVADTVLCHGFSFFAGGMRMETQNGVSDLQGPPATCPLMEQTACKHVRARGPSAGAAMLRQPPALLCCIVSSPSRFAMRSTLKPSAAACMLTSFSVLIRPQCAACKSGAEDHCENCSALCSALHAALRRLLMAGLQRVPHLHLTCLLAPLHDSQLPPHEQTGALCSQVGVCCYRAAKCPRAATSCAAAPGGRSAVTPARIS